MDRRTSSFVLLPGLVLVLLASAFQWGRATAATGRGRRHTEIVETVRHAAPAVLSVTAVLRGGRSRGSGSGVIVHPRGYVVTNSHVIQGASRITVRPFQSRERHEARVVANNPSGDLALLLITGSRRWPHVSLSPGRNLLLGETAIAIGNPRGLGDSVTVGVVSAMGRSARQRNGSTIHGLIQTDAPINSGNSGGPLLNLDGELIGINASMLPSAEGIAFAIPADAVEQMLCRALGTCPPKRARPAEATPPTIVQPAPRLGPASRATEPRAPVDTPTPRVGPAPLLQSNPDALPMRPTDVGLLIEDDGRRLLIRRVTPGSPASAAGFRPGDQLLEVDGFGVESVNEVRLAFQAAHANRVYEVRVRRNRVTVTLSLVIAR